MELSCEACAVDPQFKELSGCDQPAQVAVWDTGDGDKFYSCPLLWVTENITSWYEDYAYCKELGTNIEWEDRSVRWLEALKVYTHEYIKFQDFTIRSKGSRKNGYFNSRPKGQTSPRWDM